MTETTTTTHTAQSLAGELYRAFEVAHRPDGEPFHRLKEDAPEWMSECIRDVFHNHASHLPNDGLYNVARIAAGELEDVEDVDELEPCEGATYSNELYEWLANDPEAAGQVDELMREGGYSDLFSLLQSAHGRRLDDLRREAWTFLDDLAQVMNDELEECSCPEECDQHPSSQYHTPTAQDLDA